MEAFLESGWKKALAAEFTQDYFLRLKTTVKAAYETNTVFPPQEHIFTALQLCPLSAVKVVILGQDPYHGKGQAHGLAFSVPAGEKIPPSLLNIYKEIKTDVGIPIPASGNLEHWAKQGVLLLNTTLTVEEGAAASHEAFGWQTLTDAIITTISNKNDHIVFLLWGNHAQQKSALIDETKHLILKAPHPSPLSAHRGFLGCGHFSKTNAYLSQHEKTPIDW